jgi:hypothetical protein
MTYDKDNNRMMFFDPSDPFNTLQIVDAATGLPVGQKQNSSFWNNSTLTKFGAKDGDWGIDFAAPV